MIRTVEELLKAAREDAKGTSVEPTLAALHDILHEEGAINENVLTSIARGRYDDHLAQIVEMVRLRRETIASVMISGLRPGQRVRIIGGIRPAYLVGVVGTVDRTEGKTVHVRFDVPARRYGRNGRSVGIPASCVEVLR